MKTNFFKLVCMLAFAGGITGCSSDDSKPEVLPVECPAGFTGSNCDIPITPTKVKITGVTVRALPNTNNGESWDFDSDADIYISIHNQTTKLYESTNFYKDAFGNGSNQYPFQVQPSLTITNVLSNYYIVLMDYDAIDDIPNEDDVMGAVAFTPYDPSRGFPSTITVTNASLPIVCEINLEYEW